MHMTWRPGSIVCRLAIISRGGGEITFWPGSCAAGAFDGGEAGRVLGVHWVISCVCGAVGVLVGCAFMEGQG